MTSIDEQGKAVTGAMLGGLASGFTAALAVVVTYPEAGGWTVLLAGVAAFFVTASTTYTTVYFVPNTPREPEQIPMETGAISAQDEYLGRL
jgi:hypothetical protein